MISGDFPIDSQMKTFLDDFNEERNEKEKQWKENLEIKGENTRLKNKVDKLVVYSYCYTITWLKMPYESMVSTICSSMCCILQLFFVSFHFKDISTALVCKAAGTFQHELIFSQRIDKCL